MNFGATCDRYDPCRSINQTTDETKHSRHLTTSTFFPTGGRPPGVFKNPPHRCFSLLSGKEKWQTHQTLQPQPGEGQQIVGANAPPPVPKAPPALSWLLPSSPAARPRVPRALQSRLLQTPHVPRPRPEALFPLLPSAPRLPAVCPPASPPLQHAWSTYSACFVHTFSVPNERHLEGLFGLFSIVYRIPASLQNGVFGAFCLPLFCIFPK